MFDLLKVKACKGVVKLKETEQLLPCEQRFKTLSIDYVHKSQEHETERCQDS